MAWSQSSFVPSDLAGLKVWLNPDSGVTLNGTTVSQWLDQSANGNDASQGASLNQPAYIPNALNGHGTMRFSNDYFTTPTINIGQRTEFYVTKRNGNGVTNHVLMTNPGAPYNELYVGATDSVFKSYVNTSVNHQTIFSLNFQIISRVLSPSEVLFYKNGVQGLTLSMSNTNTSQALYIGSYAGSQFLNGDISEIIIYDQPLIDSDRELVEGYLRNKYAPAINLGADTAVCTFPIVLRAKQNYFKNYLWSDGSSKDSLIVSSPGTYIVTVTDIFDYISIDTIVVDTLFNPVFYLGNDTAICENGGASLSLSPSILGSNSYVWSTGTTSSSIVVNTSNIYSLTVTNANGCYYIDSIDVQIDSFALIATLGPDVSLCGGNPIYLVTGAAVGNTLVWSGLGSGTGDSLLVTSSGDYIVNASNANGCAKTDTINVTILGLAPTAGFTFATACFGNSNSFLNASSPPAGGSIVSNDWAFGDLSPNSVVTSPIHLYADTGTYAVSLTVTTDGGCSATAIQNVNVYPYPLGSFTFTDVCEKDTAKFISTDTTFGYPVSYNWDFGDPATGAKNVSTLANPNHIFSAPGTHTVQLVLQNAFGCSTSISNAVEIDSLPIIDFSTSPLCENELIQFTDNTTIPVSTNILSSSWDFDDFSAISTQLNPTHTYSFNKWYYVKRTVTLASGCKDSITSGILVNPQPQALYSVGTVCAETPAIFKDSSSIASGGTIINWRWDYGNGLSSTVQNDTQTFVSGLLPIVELLVTSDKGCMDSVSTIITVKPLPVAGFSVSASTGGPPLLIDFVNTSTGASTYAWDFGDSSTDSQSNPSTTYSVVGDYDVVLTAYTNFGCEDTASRLISVVEAYRDVMVKNLGTYIQNNYLYVLAQYVNKGNVDITSLDLSLNVNDGTSLKENWTGLLTKGGLVLDTISNSIYMKDFKHFVCLTADQPNGFEDAYPIDNKECISIDNSSFEVLAPYPVPASDDIITLPILIPEKKNLEIKIADAKGALLVPIYSDIIDEGLQLISIDLTGMAKGFYTFIVVYDGQTAMKKFIID